MLRTTRLQATPIMKLGHGFIYLLCLAATLCSIAYIAYVSKDNLQQSMGWGLTAAVFELVGLTLATGAVVVIFSAPCNTKLTRVIASACGIASAVAIVVFIGAVVAAFGSNLCLALAFWALPTALTFWTQFLRLTDRDIARNLREQMWAQQDGLSQRGHGG